MVLLVLGCGGAGGSAALPVTSGSEAATAGKTREAPGEITPDVRLRIVDATFGAEHSKRADPMMVPFGVNQNGTELVYVLLERASREGAAFVGDLTVLMTFRWRGDVVECRTPVLFEGDPRLSRTTTTGTAAPTSGYRTEVDVFKPQPVEADVTDRELVCRPRAVAVMKKRRVHNTSRGADHARVYDADSSSVVTVQELEKRNVCAFETITRRTTRFDYELKLGFVPPDWAHFAESYAEGKLVAAQPRCYKLAEDELGKQPEYRLTAMAYQTGAVKVAAPVRMPSRGMVEAQWSPTGGMSERTCQKILQAASQKKSPDGMRSGVEAHCTPMERMNNARDRQKGIIDDESEIDDD